MFTAMTKDDLSKFHTPLGGLFSGVDGADQPISEDDRKFYDENGYLAGIRLLNSEQVAALRQDLGALMGQEYSADPRFYEYHHHESPDRSKTLFHALGSWRVSPVFHDLIFYPRFSAAAESLLGGPVRFWHDQLFVKPAH